MLEFSFNLHMPRSDIPSWCINFVDSLNSLDNVNNGKKIYMQVHEAYGVTSWLDMEHDQPTYINFKFDDEALFDAFVLRFA